MNKYKCYLYHKLVRICPDYESAAAWLSSHVGDAFLHIEEVSSDYSSDCDIESPDVYRTNVISEDEHEEDLSMEVLERLNRLYTNSMFTYIADLESLRVKSMEVKDYSEKKNIEHMIRFDLKYIEVLQKLIEETSDKMKGSNS